MIKSGIDKIIKQAGGLQKISPELYALSENYKSIQKAISPCIGSIQRIQSIPQMNQINNINNMNQINQFSQIQNQSFNPHQYYQQPMYINPFKAQNNQYYVAIENELVKSRSLLDKLLTLPNNQHLLQFISQSETSNSNMFTSTQLLKYYLSYLP